LGSGNDPRRTSIAWLRGLRGPRLSVPTSTSTPPRRRGALASIPAHPPRRDRSHGLLCRPDGDIPPAVCLVRDRAWPAARSSVRCHRPPRGFVGGPAAPRSVSPRHRSAAPQLRSRLDLLGASRLYVEVLRHQTDEDGLPQPLAERRRRALGRQRASRTARPCRRPRRAPPRSPPPRVCRVLP